MTRKDYVAIAQAFQNAYADTVGLDAEMTAVRHTAITMALYEVATVMANDNRNFNHDMFVSAAQGEVARG
jgi:hypothetical protein